MVTKCAKQLILRVARHVRIFTEQLATAMRPYLIDIYAKRQQLRNIGDVIEDSKTRFKNQIIRSTSVSQRIQCHLQTSNSKGMRYSIPFLCLLRELLIYNAKINICAIFQKLPIMLPNILSRHHIRNSSCITASFQEVAPSIMKFQINVFPANLVTSVSKHVRQQIETQNNIIFHSFFLSAKEQALIWNHLQILSFFIISQIAG